MKNTFLFLIAIVSGSNMLVQIYIAKNCEITFFSEAPLENIAAINKAAKPILNKATTEIKIKIAMTAFVF